MVNDHPKHNYQGTLEEWDDSVFENAAVFRVHRFTHENKRSDLETTSFQMAMVAADNAIKAGYRSVLVYAVDTSGRYFAIPKDRWNHYAALWLKRKKKKKK